MTLFLIIVSITTTTICICAIIIFILLYWITKRQCPILTDNDLPKSATDNNIHIVSKLPKDASEFTKIAFMKGSDFLWMSTGRKQRIQHMMEESETKKKDDYDDKTLRDIENHRKFTSFAIDFATKTTESYGHVLVCRDNNGSSIGSMLLIPPQKGGTLVDNVRDLLIGMSMEIMPVMSLMTNKDIRIRSFTSMFALEHQHETAMKDQPHWFVKIIAVADVAQGKGIGKKLLQVAYDMAGDLPIYLECHDENVPFYQKRGFVRASQCTVEPKNTSDKTTYHYNGMVRDPKKQKLS